MRSTIIVSLLFLASMCAPVAVQASRLGQSGEAVAIAKGHSAANAMGRKISRKQALRDIDSLIFTISEVHPNMFAVCGQADFFAAADGIRQQLADSVTVTDFYRLAAPLVAMIGDGHTTMWFPYDEYRANGRPRLPLAVTVHQDSTIMVDHSAEGTVPAGSELLSVNGRSSREMVAEMMRYVSGERYFYRTDRVNGDFSALFDMLYHADSYAVEYRPEGSTAVQKATLAPAEQARPKSTAAKKQPRKRPANYSFRLMDDGRVAVMDFRSFSDPKRMGEFADSMFATLRREGIRDLIIDVRNNGGGNSAVGDTLLRYIAPKPFKQFGKSLARVTPTTRRLGNRGVPAPGWYYYAGAAASPMVEPRTTAEGHYDGRVWLLVSHHTFSSASSFSWAFKYFGMGTVVGEETGGMNVSYGDVLRYRLPNSGLSCSVSWKRFWQYGADESEIHGTLPDVTVPQAEALDAALQLIEKSRP